MGLLTERIAVTTRSDSPAGASLITVVLAVHGVADYLPACLDSLLGQPAPPGGLEVVAVDDASADSCGVILDERAAREPRLRVIHLPSRQGPGPARMRGLAAAAGAYVWFVDPDDLLAPGCLTAIADRLARDRPDVLLIDYLMLYPAGRAEPSPWAALLAAPGGTGSPVTLAARPVLINRTMTLWSKVIKRDFLAGLRLEFPAGIHEDVTVSCALLLRAGRISLLGRVCYLYRQRAGSFLTTPGLGHFAIFPAYERVFQLVGEVGGNGAGVPGAVGAAVFGRAIEHYNSILAGGLIPRSARRDFFGHIRDDFLRYRPPGYQRPRGLRGLRIKMIERNQFRLYTALVPVNRARVSGRRALRRLRWRKRDRYGPLKTGVTAAGPAAKHPPPGGTSRRVGPTPLSGLSGDERFMAMRHTLGLILALALAAALFFGAGWGVTHMPAFAGHSVGLPSRTGLTALATLAGTGLLAGILVAAPLVSPLATGLPGLAVLAWTAMLAVSYHRAVGWVPMQGHSFSAGFRMMLTSGFLALAGMVLIIPLFMPARWHRLPAGDEDDEAGLPAPTGLLS
jgi:glycosyltransferase involved in cell wall biosynthesis